VTGAGRTGSVVDAAIDGVPHVAAS